MQTPPTGVLELSEILACGLSRSRAMLRAASGLVGSFRMVLALGVALAACVAVAQHPVAGADEDCPPNIGYQPECQYRPFYTPSDPLPVGVPGDLIRTEPSRIALDPAGHGNYSATGTRLMYQSINGRGQPVAVTGTYFEPDRPWPGSGPRTLIALASWSQGLGDQCAISRPVSDADRFNGQPTTPNCQQLAPFELP